jgi:molecular chaperone GrpE
MSEPVDDSTEVYDNDNNVAELQLALDEQTKKAADYYDQLLRARAEFDNFRKRSEKEKQEARAWGKQDVLLPLLQLVDVFEQALAQTDKASDVKLIRQGLEFLHKNFASFLKAEGLEVLDVVGKPLDPNTSEVMDQVEVDEDQAGLVLSEYQRGYKLQGRILRPSRVRMGVARKTENLAENSETTEES